jgi:hypothetical protein
MSTKQLSGAITIIVMFTLLSYGQGNTFKKVRYNGGSIASTVKPDEWDNTLIVNSDKITFIFKDGVVKDIDPKTVTGLSYGSEATKRTKTIIALAVLLTPLALFALMHKNRKHFVGIEWKEEGDKKGGVLLQGDKNNYKGMLMALRGVTGAAVAVAASERKYVPTGVEVITTDDEKKKKKDENKNEKAKEN